MKKFICFSVLVFSLWAADLVHASEGFYAKAKYSDGSTKTLTYDTLKLAVKDLQGTCDIQKEDLKFDRTYVKLRTAKIYSDSGKFITDVKC
jgi:hypothetical protein